MDRIRESTFRFFSRKCNACEFYLVNSEIQKKKIDFIDRKQSNPDGFPGLVRIYCCCI